jgi:hypothetical protein
MNKVKSLYEQIKDGEVTKVESPEYGVSKK